MENKELKREDWELVFVNNSANGSKPLTGIEFCSLLNLTLNEVEKLTEKEEGKRTIELYKQKCKASLVAAIKKEPRLVLEYYKYEYLNDKKEDEEGAKLIIK